MAGFFKAKALNDKNTTRLAEEMPSHGEDRQEFLAYLHAHEEGVTQAQLFGLAVDELLSLPPPHDEPEYWVSGGPRFAPLIGGTTADERFLIIERLQQNAAKDSKKALAAGKPDPWAWAPYPPHHHIPGLSRPYHPSPELGRGVMAGVTQYGREEKVAANPLARLVAESGERSQRKLRGNSTGRKGGVMEKCGRGALRANIGRNPCALSPIQERDEVEEISGDKFLVASIETVPANSAGPRGTKRSLSSAAGQQPAKKTKPFGLALGIASSSIITNPAAVIALADARPEPSRLPVKRRASDMEGEEEERAVKRPRQMKLEPQHATRKSSRIQLRALSEAVVPVENPLRREASMTAGPSKESASAAVSGQEKVRQPAKTGSKVSVTKNRKTPKASKAKTQSGAAAKPTRKKVKRACDECRRKHSSCVHGENATRMTSI